MEELVENLMRSSFAQVNDKDSMDDQFKQAVEK